MEWEGGKVGEGLGEIPFSFPLRRAEGEEEVLMNEGERGKAGEELFVDGEVVEPEVLEAYGGFGFAKEIESRSRCLCRSTEGWT